MKLVNDFSIQTLKLFYEIYSTGLDENRRAEKINAIPTQSWNEFGKLYKAVDAGKVTETQIKDRLCVLEHGAGALTYDQFKDIQDNDRWSLQEMSDFCRQHPDLYHKYSTKYMDEIVHRKNSGVR